MESAQTTNANREREKSVAFGSANAMGARAASGQSVMYFGEHMRPWRGGRVEEKRGEERQVEVERRQAAPVGLIVSVSLVVLTCV